MNRLPAQYRRYLRLLGIVSQPAGLDGLRRIVHQHLLNVPFENVSKLLLLDREGAGRPTTLTEFLDGIEYHDLGGTCYTSNPFLSELLLALGYDAHLLGADMNNPNVHTCVRVKLDGVDWHVDVGYAAPLRHPMRLDLLPHQVVQGQTRYLLDRDGGAGCYSMSVFVRDVKVHGYVVHPPPRPQEFFHPIVLDSYVPGRMFVSSLRITRFFDDGVVELKGPQLTSDRGGVHQETRLETLDDLVSAARTTLALPRCPIEKAVRILERLTGVSFFDGVST